METYRRRDVVLEAINLQDNGGFASALEREVAGVRLVEDEDPHFVVSMTQRTRMRLRTGVQYAQRQYG